MADVKPIRTEADYDAAMEALEGLWGAKSGTPRGDRLDVLATLIEAYEEKKHPIDPPDPVDAILFRMDQMGLTRPWPGRPPPTQYAMGRSAVPSLTDDFELRRLVAGFLFEIVVSISPAAQRPARTFAWNATIGLSTKWRCAGR